ncbi:hypothetical protein PtrM4_107110 [Pyrenophora tritici-repentis]|uniref:Uncharacterized protein n=1 Tax=Pyrenophora tritici-repentis TaxID=45151 RepID=A0A834RVI7_9PLEO|nr:hypothetical protein PtrM4_107110 [Pyrenophora tritici-repentis]
MCEDATLIKRWFKLVEEIKAEQGICDEDVYNFDKAGFIMGKITTQLVITVETRLKKANSAASARRQRSKRRIQKHGVLTKGAREDILAQNEADQQIAHKER